VSKSLVGRRKQEKSRIYLEQSVNQRYDSAMNKTSKIAACVPLVAGVCVSADPPPRTEISNGSIRAQLFLPDAKSGFYRGTRFDWSGVIGSLEYAGHDYFPQWFQRVDADVHDFVYGGEDIVASPCTAITGPSEEFVSNGQALGFDEAATGGTFIKIGVGVLRRPDDSRYDPYRLYEIVDGGKWIVLCKPDSVEFSQELSDPLTGYGYEYRKRVFLAQAEPRMVLDHSLRNRGKRVIQTSVYNHNFLYLDRQPPSPEVTIKLPFAIQASPAPKKGLVEVRGNEILFLKTLQGEESVYMGISGFGADPKDYDIRIENRKVGAGLRITGDRALARMALWAIRAPLSIEPFIDMTIEPGAEFSWRITYDFYTLPER
jgi:hypothetical protein